MKATRTHVVECELFLTWPMSEAEAEALAIKLNHDPERRCESQHHVRRAWSSDRPGSRFWDFDEWGDDEQDEAHN